MEPIMEESAKEERSSTTTTGPEVQVPVQAKRRRISLTEKARIVALVEASKPDDRGLVLRREGVYSSQVSKWRHQVCEGAGSEKKRGPKKQFWPAWTRQNSPSLRHRARSDSPGP